VSSTLAQPPPAQIYTLSLHDALPISCRQPASPATTAAGTRDPARCPDLGPASWPPRQCRVAHHRGRMHSRGDRHAGALRTAARRSEEHTSELQSRENLVCRLLLEKKK